MHAFLARRALREPADGFPLTACEEATDAMTEMFMWGGADSEDPLTCPASYQASIANVTDACGDCGLRWNTCEDATLPHDHAYAVYEVSSALVLSNFSLGGGERLLSLPQPVEELPLDRLQLGRKLAALALELPDLLVEFLLHGGHGALNGSDPLGDAALPPLKHAADVASLLLQGSS